MFLSYLNDLNKEGFLKICVHAALANGVFAREEQEAVDAYCREMDVAAHIPETPEPFDTLLDALSITTSQAEKRIIVLEILALVKSDGVYDEKEQEFMAKLIRGLHVPQEDLSELSLLLDKYIEIGKEMYAAIIAE